jgi:hypothetical protein
MEEAMDMEDKDSQILAIDKEMDALINNDTWDILSFPKGRKPIRSKWVFKKISLDGNVEKNK